MKQAELRAGNLAVTVNAEGAFGWCGLSRIEHTEYAKEWLLSPAFTLEHYIGIPLDSNEYIEYEPCCSSKHLQSVSSDKCTLHYDQYSCSRIEFTVDYHIVAPHYINMTMRMKTARLNWPLNHVALFFATIVRAPIYTGINLLGKDTLAEVKDENCWIHFNGTAVQQGQTAHPIEVMNPELPRPPHAPNTYYFSDSSIRFQQPFFYAPIDNMVFAVMFRPEDRERIRFTVNPLAPAFGGPAWDFLWNIAKPIPEERYLLSCRSMFKPFISRDDILREYDKYLTS